MPGLALVPDTPGQQVLGAPWSHAGLALVSGRSLELYSRSGDSSSSLVG